MRHPPGSEPACRHKAVLSRLYCRTGAAPPEHCRRSWAYLEMMDELREAVERLRDYHEFEPDRINRRRINAQLRA
jgi:hypothetical protein